MAFITVPVIFTTFVAVHYIRKRNRDRALLSKPSGRAVEDLDPSVVSATIVLTTLPGQVMEKTLELLPPEMARSIILVLPELPPIANSTVEREMNRWLSHFQPPRANIDDIEWEEPSRLAAATVKLVLEDTA